MSGHLHRWESAGMDLLRQLDILRASFFWPVWCMLTAVLAIDSARPFRAGSLRSFPCHGHISIDSRGISVRLFYPGIDLGGLCLV